MNGKNKNPEYGTSFVEKELITFLALNDIAIFLAAGMDPDDIMKLSILCVKPALFGFLHDKL